MTDSIFDKTKDMFNNTKEKIENINETIINKTNNIIGEIKGFSISNIESKLEYIGYNISKVEISITLPPRIMFQIDLEKSKLDLEKEKELLKEEKTNDLMIIEKIIAGINKALDLKEKVIFNSKELKYLEIEVSLIPTIKLVYLDR